MAMVKATFYLPIRDNDGRSLADEIKDAEQRLWESFHAFTRAGVVTGAYRMADGTRAADDLKRYELVLDDERLADLKAILHAFKSATTQEAIYLEVLYNVDIDFVSGKAAMTERETLEAEIAAVILNATNGTELSNDLFAAPDGLFGRLAAIENNHREIARTALYRRAQDRIHELDELELDCLKKLRADIARTNAAVPSNLGQSAEVVH